MNPLKRLAIRHGTDKFGPHDYTGFYWDLLAHRRYEPLRLLEIGIGGYSSATEGGASLAMWRDFFPQAVIVGVDCFQKELTLGPRVHCVRGNQADPAFLQYLSANYGPFDVIVDDGSHVNQHVIFSFECLFPDLRTGGLYIVEDTQTSFFEDFGGGLDQGPDTIVGYFGRLWTEIDHAEIRSRHPQAEVHSAARTIKRLDRAHNILAVHKGANDYPSNFAMKQANPEQLDDILSELIMEKGPRDVNRLRVLFDVLLSAGRFDRAASTLMSMQRLKPLPRSYFECAISLAIANGESLKAAGLVEELSAYDERTSKLY